jgi:NADPH:quinone reductase-like Zn-dependent oxidoreductase
MADVDAADALVCGWGGGVSLAELELARAAGFRTAMIASRPSRLALLRARGITALDRRGFADATFEADVLRAIAALSDGQGAAIFIDNIGAHYRLTLKALARQGVITTSGWKRNATFPTMRSMECISRHLHVFTHYARYAEGGQAVRHALEHGWMAPPVEHIYGWDDIPQLVHDYAADSIDSYFPIFAINGPVAGTTKDVP